MKTKKAGAKADVKPATAADAELLATVRRLVEERVGQNASFAEIEAASLQVYGELYRQYQEQELARREKA